MPLSIILSIIISFIVININIFNHSAALRNIFFVSAQNAAGKVLGASEMLPAGHLEAAQNKPVEIKPIAINKDGVNFSLSATSSAAIDCKSGKTLYNKEMNQKWPLASITKLMTALVFVGHNPGWDSMVEIKKEDRREGGRIYLFTGEKMKIMDLFYFTLVGSDNTAAAALARSTGLSEEEFVAEMNKKAEILKLKNTHFEDMTGLSSNNVSTAWEIAELAKEAFANEEISRATLTPHYEFTTEGGRKKSIDSTDFLLDIFPQNGIKIMGGKTGFIDASGYCFVGKFTNHAGDEIISVVLGTDSKNARFQQTKKLVEWIYGNYQW